MRGSHEATKARRGGQEGVSKKGCPSFWAARLETNRYSRKHVGGFCAAPILGFFVSSCLRVNQSSGAKAADAVWGHTGLQGHRKGDPGQGIEPVSCKSCKSCLKNVFFSRSFPNSPSSCLRENPNSGAKSADAVWGHSGLQGHRKGDPGRGVPPISLTSREANGVLGCSLVGIAIRPV
jgi:hypothetical protein